METKVVKEGLDEEALEANLALKEGPNIITIIARETKTLFKRKSFTIYRQRTSPRVENEESFLLQNSLMP